MKNLFKNPFFYINIFLLILLILLAGSINPNSTNLPSFAKKAIAAVQNIIGQGTVNYLAAFTGANQIGNSIIYDTGSNVGIGITNPNAKLSTYNQTCPSGWGCHISTWDIAAQSAQLYGILKVSGNVYANDYWIGAAGKWASQAVTEIRLALCHDQNTSCTPTCPSGYIASNVVCTNDPPGGYGPGWNNDCFVICYK